MTKAFNEEYILLLSESEFRLKDRLGKIGAPEEICIMVGKLYLNYRLEVPVFLLSEVRTVLVCL